MWIQVEWVVWFLQVQSAGEFQTLKYSPTDFSTTDSGIVWGINFHQKLQIAKWIVNLLDISTSYDLFIACYDSFCGHLNRSFLVIQNETDMGRIKFQCAVFFYLVGVTFCQMISGFAASWEEMGKSAVSVSNHKHTRTLLMTLFCQYDNDFTNEIDSNYVLTKGMARMKFLDVGNEYNEIKKIGKYFFACYSFLQNFLFDSEEQRMLHRELPCILIQIFGFVSKEDRKNLKLVCSSFRTIITEQFFRKDKWIHSIAELQALKYQPQCINQLQLQCTPRGLWYITQTELGYPTQHDYQIPCFKYSDTHQ